MEVAVIVTRAIVGALLIAAGVAKLRLGPRHTLAAVMGYRIVGRRAAVALAWALPVLEIAIGILLTSGMAPFAGIVGATALLGSFSIAIAIALIRGQRNNCGCGARERPIGWSMVARNALLLVALVGIDRVA